MVHFEILGSLALPELISGQSFFWEHFVWINWKNWTLSQLFWPFAKGATGYITFASLMKWIRTFLSTCLSTHPCAPQLNTVIYLTLDLKPMMFSHIWGDPNSPWLQTQNSALCNCQRTYHTPSQKGARFATKTPLAKTLPIKVVPINLLNPKMIQACLEKKTSHFKDHPNEIDAHGVKPYQYSKKHVFELDNS